MNSTTLDDTDCSVHLDDEAESLSIDPRSFRVFEFEGDKLLFDRATGTVAGLDEMSFTMLSLLGAGFSVAETVRLCKRSVPGFEEDAVVGTLEHLQSLGFFRYEKVDHDEQLKMIEMLAEHRPRRVQLLMAQGCNLGCRYCYAWRNGSNQKGTLMPWEMAKESVDHLVRNSGNRPELQVTFFGGEPLLNWEVILQVVEYCRELERTTSKTFLFELITNGVLLTPEITDFIAKEKFLLFVSLDGWKEMHNYNRPSMSGEDVYDVILQNALYANKRYEELGLNPMKIRANLTNKHHDWKAVGEYLASLGFKVIGVGAIEPLSHGDPSPSSMTEEQVDALHEEISKGMAQTVYKLIDGKETTFFERLQLKKAVMPLSPHGLKGVTCGVARNTQVVDNKGNIFPCHRYEGMENYIIGNVAAGGLDREKTMAYYLKLNGNATNRCHSCWIRDYCGGGCAWLLSKKDGHLADPTERECDRRRASMERALWLRQKMRTYFPEKFTRDGEIDLDSWDWGAETDSDEPDALLGTPSAESSSCGSDSKCENCGPSGCAE